MTATQGRAAIGAARTAYGTTGTWVAYAVVATAAALRGTRKDILAHALAIAGEAAPNCTMMSAPALHDPLPEGSDVKEGIPWSVVAGLYALGAAEKGMTGPRNILDSVRHYRLPADFEQVLHSGWRIDESYYKFYCCCRHIHGPLDALQELMTKHRIQASDIQASKSKPTRTRPALRTGASPKACPTFNTASPIAWRSAHFPGRGHCCHSRRRTSAARTCLLSPGRFRCP
ncbi:MmgE/PrpD family protein [Ensifer sp. IC4062]|nr:MmgE/PrpD family protein [Ensifer sp. IC4062]